MTDSPTAASPAVVLVVALRAEARPLIAHFGLRRDPRQTTFAWYAAAGGPVALVVSGPGRVAAGAAVARVATAIADAAWLNIGIAGHGDQPLGRAFLAHRVADAASGRRWYPPLVFTPPCPTAALRTVDTPCTDYPDDTLYDMEGAGFYEIAARHAPHELVHCLKVVSDNRRQPASLLDGARVSELVSAALPITEQLVERLAALAHELRLLNAEPPGFEELLARAHFSATRRRQLRHALRRWAVLLPATTAPAWVAAQGVRGAAGIVTAIEKHLDKQPVTLRPQP